MTLNLKFSEAANKILGILYLFEFEEGDSFYSLPVILKGLGYNFSFDIMKDIAHHLESDQFIDAVFLPGALFVRILSKGLSKIEEQGDLLMEEMIKEREKVEKVSFDLNINELNRTSRYSKSVIDDELDNLRNLIDEYAGGKSDLHKDIKIIRIELSKNSPDFDTIEQKMEQLSSQGFLKEAVERFRSFLYY